jgi:hypothetical protein
MIINSNPYVNYIDQTRQQTAAKIECLHDDDESDEESELSHVYLTVDLSADIVAKLKNLNTGELDQMKQIGILSVQFANDDLKVSIPADRPPPHHHRSYADPIVRRDLDHPRSLLVANNPSATNLLHSQQNEAGKRRSRKTISELTSPNVHDSREAAETGPADGRKIARNKRNSKEMEPLMIQHSCPGSGSLSQPHSASSPYVLTSMIVDQSPNSNLSVYPASAQLNSQFNYLKQFTMPSPMLSNMLNSGTESASANSALLLAPNDKLMHMDEYKNIYQMRQELASQVGVSVKEEEKSGAQPAKKARVRGPNNTDPNKPRVKRNRQPKAETIQAMSGNSALKSTDGSSQPQLIRNMIGNNSNSMAANVVSSDSVIDSAVNSASAENSSNQIPPS